MYVFLCIMVLFPFNDEALPLQKFQEIPSVVEDLMRHKDENINSIRGPVVPVINLTQEVNQIGKWKQGEILRSGKESTDDKCISLEEYVQQHRKEKNTGIYDSENLTVSQEPPTSDKDMKNISINVIQQGSNFKEENIERNKHPHAVPSKIRFKITPADNPASSNHTKDKSKTSGNNVTCVRNNTTVSRMSKTTGNPESNDKKHKGETHKGETTTRASHHKKDRGREEKKTGGIMKFLTKKLQVGNKSVENEKLQPNRNESVETKKQAKGDHPHASERESKQKHSKLHKNVKESEVKATRDKTSHLHRATNKMKVDLVDVSRHLQSQDSTAQLSTGIDSSGGNELRQHNASKTQHSHKSLEKGRWEKSEENEPHANASADRKAPVKSNEIILQIKLNESRGVKHKPEDAFKTKTNKLLDMKNEQKLQTTTVRTLNELHRHNHTKTKPKTPDKGKSVESLDRKHDIIQNRTKDHGYTKHSDKEDDSYESRPEPGRERTHECQEHAHDKISHEEDDERNSNIEKQFGNTKEATEFPQKVNVGNVKVKVLPLIRKPFGDQEIGSNSDKKSRVQPPHVMKPTGAKSNTKGSNKHRTHINGTVRPYHLDNDTPEKNDEEKNGGHKNESVSTPSVKEKNTILHGYRSEIPNGTGSSKSETTTKPFQHEEQDDIYIDASQINAENNLQDADIPLDEQTDITENHRFENNVHEQKDTESSTSETPQLHTSGNAEEWTSTSAQDDPTPSNQTTEVTISPTKSEEVCSNTEEIMFTNTETSTEKKRENENSKEGSVNDRKWEQYNTALHQEEASGRENNYGPQLADTQHLESTRPGTVSESMELPVWGVQNFRSTPMTMD